MGVGRMPLSNIIYSTPDGGRTLTTYLLAPGGRGYGIELKQIAQLDAGAHPRVVNVHRHHRPAVRRHLQSILRLSFNCMYIQVMTKLESFQWKNCLFDLNNLIENSDKICQTPFLGPRTQEIYFSYNKLC